MPIKTLFYYAVLFLLFTTSLFAAQATLAWNPNTESDLAGYKVYYGNSSGNYDNNVDVGNQTNYTVLDLASDQGYFFAITAYDTSGNESDYSGELPYNVPHYVLEYYVLDVKNLSGETVDIAPPNTVDNLRGEM